MQLIFLTNFSNSVLAISSAANVQISQECIDSLVAAGYFISMPMMLETLIVSAMLVQYSA